MSPNVRTSTHSLVKRAAPLLVGLGLVAAACSTQSAQKADQNEKAVEAKSTDSKAATQKASADSQSLRFETKPAMYAANEEWLTFACELPDGQVPIGAKNSMEMYYYSMYGLGNLLFRSGMGVHMVHNPLFQKHVAEDKGMPWYQKKNGAKIFMKHKMKQFVERSAAYEADNQFPPKNSFPVYLEYSSGQPTFQTNPVMSDFGTLRWDQASMDRTMSPGGWGQAMMKQVL